ncbi:MAG TPA: S41 family peptidase [Chitinophagales bacterium]|nr:S41 family peptidase [Chitinophagales bacterium]
MKSKLIKGFVVIAIGLGTMSFADSYFEISKNLDVFSALYKEVNTYYVDDVEPSKLMRSCIDGMLKTLDPFTNYFSGSQIENARIHQGGKFGGIGVEVEVMGAYPVITSVTQNQPADKSGVQAGDVIKVIDGESTLNRKKDEVEKFLVGQPKSSINIQVERKTSLLDSKILNFTMQREEIQETSVPFYGMVTPEVGCIKLKIFNEGAGKDVKDAFDSLKKANPNMKGVILDLRSNPGGLLTEAVNIVNVFVEKNQLVVTTKGKVDEWNSAFKTLNEPSDTKIPVVMITNSMSASASEIVSGTMQDYDRGVVIGQRTYGKGLVQVTKPLSYNTMLKVTTAKYYIPTGRCIQALNYAEKNADGSVKRIPDSLKVAFKTLKSGRTVFDGGGVDPDVKLAKPEHSKIAETLFTRNYIFEFASVYKLMHDTITDAAKFKLTEKDFNDFVAYVKSKDYSYKTESEEKLEALKEAATDEKYFDAVKAQYDAIKQKIARDKEQDILKNKAEIITVLENEIAGRYYYAYGKVKKSYQNDPEVAKAIELINNQQQYTEILARK